MSTIRGQNSSADVDRVGFGAIATGATIRPLGGQVLVLQDDESDPDRKMAPGSLILAGPTRELPELLKGTVQAVGPGRWSPEAGRIAIPLQAGDRVCWQRNYGTLLERAPGDPRQRLMIREEFLEAVLEE